MSGRNRATERRTRETKPEETKPEETKRITGTAEMWQPEKVAAIIMKGIEKEKFTITPGMEIMLLNRLHSLLAPVLNWYFDGIVRKVRGS